MIALLLAIGIASVWWQAVLPAGHGVVLCGQGRICFIWFGTNFGPANAGLVALGPDAQIHWWVMFQMTQMPGLRATTLEIPLWLVALFVAVPTAFLWWRDRAVLGPGKCQTCGYELGAIISGTRCPECGNTNQ